MPTESDLPTLAELARARAAAVVIAGVLLVVAVLPAERGIDPTGVGGRLGLTALAAGKTAAAAQVKPAAATLKPVEFAFHTDELSVTLRPGEGTEVKAVMRVGDQISYEWATDGAKVHFEFHGEAKGAAPDEYTSYELGSAAGAAGDFEAPFEGIHGWYWKNQTAAPVTIRLKTTGMYATISRIH